VEKKWLRPTSSLIPLHPLPPLLLISNYLHFAHLPQTGSYWELRYLVFNLKDSSLLVFESDREIRSNIKARIPMAELVNAEAPPAHAASKSHEFMVKSAKRTYHFRATTKEHRDAWIRIINTVSPKVGQHTAAQAIRSRLNSGARSRRSTINTP
jgi:hypothetical protein